MTIKWIYFVCTFYMRSDSLLSLFSTPEYIFTKKQNLRIFTDKIAQTYNAYVREIKQCIECYLLDESLGTRNIKGKKKNKEI